MTIDYAVLRNVPFHRREFVAREIKAYFNLDLALLRGYGLGDDATKLLTSLALFKVRRFLTTGLRLRTACDLTVDGNLTVTQPKDFLVPDEPTLLAECGRLIAACGKAGLFAKPPITEVKWEPEQVQLCAQGLILRENGYHCEGGILYFIDSRRRVSSPFDERLVERTREPVGQMRAMAASNVIPPPCARPRRCLAAVGAGAGCHARKERRRAHERAASQERRAPHGSVGRGVGPWPLAGIRPPVCGGQD